MINIGIERKINKLVNMGYEEVNEEFLYKIAKSFYMNEKKTDDFIKNNMREGYNIGFILKRNSHTFDEDFIRKHSIKWFKRYIRKFKRMPGNS